MTDATTPKRVIVYVNDSEKEPFTEWLYGLRDVMGANVSWPAFPACNKATMGIVSRSGKGVSELRLFFGSVYRVYFGEHGNDIVVLLCGSDKGS